MTMVLIGPLLAPWCGRRVVVPGAPKTPGIIEGPKHAAADAERIASVAGLGAAADAERGLSVGTLVGTLSGDAVGQLSGDSAIARLSAL